MRPPTRSCASSTSTLRPARAKSCAAARPAAPAPRIKTSVSFAFVTRARASLPPLLTFVARLALAQVCHHVLLAIEHPREHARGRLGQHGRGHGRELRLPRRPRYAELV